MIAPCIQMRPASLRHVIIASAVILSTNGVWAATRNVPSGASLQAAIDAAQPGDTLLLAAGATFTGPIHLRNKPGNSSEWITIRTATPDGVFPLPGNRVNPSHAPLMAKIVAGLAALPAVVTEHGAHHYRLIGLEIMPSSPTLYLRELVTLGDGSSKQNILAAVANNLEMSRCYIHGLGQDIVRGIALNSASTTIEDSYVSQIHSAFDAQAIGGWNGPGPFDILNNYLEASGENVAFGGADPAIPNLIPSNIRILRNYMFKPLSWKNTSWNVKNLLELKMGQNVLIEGNTFENNWQSGQNGNAIVIAVRNQDGGSPWATIRDVVFRNNIVMNAGSAIGILGKDDRPFASVLADNILIENNLFLKVEPAAGGVGDFLKISTPPTRLVVTHNTFQGRSCLSLLNVVGAAASGFVMKDNMIGTHEYGFISGDGYGTGLKAINGHFPGAVVTNNVFGGSMIPGRLSPSDVPSSNTVVSATAFEANFTDLAAGDATLSSTSRHRKAASDGTDIGVSMSRLEVALAAVGAPRRPMNLRLQPQ